jgi:hypothetical protein
MRMKLFFASIALALTGTFAWAGPAAATVITITETGSIIDGSDDGAQFGAAFADLAGLDFTVTYRFDTDQTALQSGSSPGVSIYADRSGYGTASLTINGVTRTVLGDDTASSLTYRSNNNPEFYGFSSSIFNVVQALDGNYVEDYLAMAAPLGSLDLTAPFYHRVTAADPYSYVYSAIDGTHLHMTIETLSANGSSPAPETATWALMLGGFGLIGSSMRRRRHPVVARLS